MIRKKIHNIVVYLAAIALPLVVACSSQEESLPPYGNEEATLLINLEPIGLSRAAGEQLLDNEKMRSVRVVVLHDADGTVEHNRHFTLEGAQAQKKILLKVTPNEKKKIFLFANEESVSAVEGTQSGSQTLTDFFQSYDENDVGFEAAVNELYFAPDYSESRPIPMSSVYKIDFPVKGNFEGTFHVVRVATKFTINFRNWRGEDVTVSNLSIEKHADKNFLMAHVNDSEQNRQLFNGKTWIQWLKDVSDASSENDDYTTTEAAGWLKDYDLPAQADKSITYTHSALTVEAASFNGNNPANSHPGEASTVFYLPESQNLKDGGATDKEQEYTLKLNIDDDGSNESFVYRLPNLKALFRNTHVVVNITMYYNLELSVDVIPFTEIEDLEPDYGLKREELTGYIETKDKNGNTCWFDGGNGPYYLGPRDAIGKPVNIKGTDYLLVYTDVCANDGTVITSGNERKTVNLHHIYEIHEEKIQKKYLLTPEAITGYTHGDDWYFNNLQQVVHLDGDYVFPIASFYDETNKVQYSNTFWVTAYEGTTVKCCLTLNEWDRYDWDRGHWWGWANLYPKYWFDIFGNRHTWEEGKTREARLKIIGNEWVKYLEDY